MQDIVACKGIITGSLANRYQTPTYRKDTDSLHDIDVVFTESTNDFFKNNPNWSAYNKQTQQKAQNQEALIEEIK
jgi:hypothetical protein